jgi:hypothetical protein
MTTAFASLRRNVLPTLILVGVSLLTSAVGAAGVGVWTTNGPASGQVGAFAVDLQLPGVLYAGSPSGISKSSDNGQTWTPIAGLPQGVYSLAASGGTVCATTLFNGGSTIFKSTDGGSEWQPISQQPQTMFSVTFDPTAPTTLYRISTVVPVNIPAIWVGRLHRSTDGGNSFTEIDQGLGYNVISALAIDPKNPATLYVATNPIASGYPPPFPNQHPAPLPPPSVFKSTDSGSTWALLTDTLGAIRSLVVDPVTPTTVYAVGTGLFRSTDGGAAFTLTNSTAGVSSLVIDPAYPNRLYAASSNGSGVVRSFDSGTTWSAFSTGLAGASLGVTGLLMDSTGTYLHATTGAPGVFDYEIVSDPGVLTLNGAHSFSITLSATDQRTGRAGSGVATQINDLWGYFSIPAITSNPNNPEVFVKMLDGTALNGSYWFFYGGLTDLEYTLTVKDDASGVTKTYSKPAGSECGGSDTAAFTP